MRWWLLVMVLMVGGIAGAETLDDPAMLALIRSAPTAQQYPHDDAVWLLRDIAIDVDPSGAFTVREHKILKILTQQGISLARWEIPYDKADETLQVTTARTWLNGKRYTVDPAQMAESSVYPGAAWYDSMVVRRFPLPAAAVGAVLEVQTEIRHTRPRVPQAFSTRLYLAQRFPVLDARYFVRVPDALRLSIRFTGEASPAVSEQVQGDARVYAWSVTQLPSLRIHEPQTPPAEDLTPSVHLTSLSSWQPVVAWYESITRDKAVLTDDLRRVAAEKTAGCAGDAAKIAALFAAVRAIPYVAAEMGEMSDVPHNAEEVARQNYGDCKDKATLLRALLHAVGIESNYVLARTTNRGALDTTQCGAEEFNHVLLAVPTPRGDLFLDPSNPHTPVGQLPPGVAGAGAVIIRGAGQLVTLPAATPAENHTSIAVRITVAPDGGASGNATLTFTGSNALIQRSMLATIAPDRYKDALEGYLASRLGPETMITAVTVEGVSAPESALVITAAFTAPAFLQPLGDRYTGALPLFAYQPNRLRGQQERRYPYAFDTAGSMHLEAMISLPNAFAVVQLPSSVEERSVFGAFRDAIQETPDHTIAYTCDLTANRGVFPADTVAEMGQWASVLAFERRNGLQFVLRRQP